jgi:hypothetical protein
VTRTEEFEQLRPLLFSIAYRMPGSACERPVFRTGTRFTVP